MKSKIITYCVVIVSNLLILAVLFEILSRLFLSDYIDSKLNKVVHRYQSDSFFKDELIYMPHPYLGYVRSNEDENFDILDKKKDPNDFIAVFGGSVAENFYHFNKRTGLLQESLKEIFGLKNKDNFGLRNYATGGYRQPQQLIATVLFRPKVKITINIEGNNELNEALGDQFPYYYPMWSISKLYYSGIKNWNIYIKAGKIRMIQKKMKTFMERKNNWFEFIPNFFKILYFFGEKYLVILDKKLSRQMGQGQKMVFFKPLSFFEKMIYWLERSCEQQNFLAKRGIKSYFFFQPSPYVPRSKKELTDHEKQMIKNFESETWSWSQNHMENMKKSFLLIRKLIKKENLSLNMVDLSQVFINESREVFRDGCCHLNLLGRSLLAQEIAKIIKRTYSESEKPKLCHDDFRDLVKKSGAFGF